MFWPLFCPCKINHLLNKFNCTYNQYKKLTDKMKLHGLQYYAKLLFCIIFGLIVVKSNTKNNTVSHWIKPFCDSSGIYNDCHKKYLYSWKNIAKSVDNISTVMFTFVAIQQFNKNWLFKIKETITLFFSSASLRK